MRLGHDARTPARAQLAAIKTLARYLLMRTGERIVLSVRLSLVDHLMRLRMGVYDSHRVGDLLSRAGADSSALRLVVADGVSQLLAGGVVVLGAAAFMVWLDWQLFLIVAAFVTVAGLGMASVLHGIGKTSVAAQTALGAITSDLERALGAIRTVRASQAEELETERIGDDARRAKVAGVRMARYEAAIGRASRWRSTARFSSCCWSAAYGQGTGRRRWASWSRSCCT